MVHLLGEIITGKEWGGNGFITLCVMAHAPFAADWSSLQDCSSLEPPGRAKQGERARRQDRPFSLDSARALPPLRPGLPAARLPVTFFIL
jgi:hypothetical protein